MDDRFKYYFDSIDRRAIAVKPKQPMRDWLSAVSEESTVLLNEHNLYLVDGPDFSEDYEKWIKEHFDRIFKCELNDRFDDQSLWPVNRTYEMFTEWFEADFFSLILDMENGPVEKYTIDEEDGIRLTD